MNDYEGYESYLFWSLPTPVRQEDVERVIAEIGNDKHAKGIVNALELWLELNSTVYIDRARKEAFAADKAAKQAEEAELAARIAAMEAMEKRERSGWRGLRRSARRGVRYLKWRVWAYHNERRLNEVER